MQLTWLLRVTIVFTLLVILMGAYTRLSDAGLGCPDWPGCYGHIKVPTHDHEISHAQTLFPDHDIHPEKAWLEMIHRYIAGALGILVLLVFILCLKTSEAPKKLPLAIVLLIIFQAALGMWTVTMKLMPIVVMFHLIGGFSLLSLLLLLYLRTRPRRIFETADIHSQRAAGAGFNGAHGSRIGTSLKFIGQSKHLPKLALLSLLVLIGQIMLGAWTSSNYAALACTALPICEGNWMDNLAIADAFSPFQGQHPSFEFGVLDYHARMTIHIAHRVGAIITASLLLLLAYRLFFSTQLKALSLLLVALVILQVSLGISNVVMHLPLGIAVSHNGGAALLLLALVAINYFLWHKPSSTSRV
ncbi:MULTISPECIES: COX15/CtaA family protein [Shewanella]|jgi:cytochrome c oxidase assembly protein subunit 15|uniref:COX15/CtaA family protein n=1 Tax=Shewanella TaxID=22 RepID=UPI000C12A557|nr:MULTISPECIES: COX15/CtaA family protein [Shewanella]MCD8550448.1 COX15/CtaA family protein [Shewanella xiamenensis]MCD8558821.1 COX15/CtaA family protein [Shewanella xiamenensis]PHY61734.1 cytochrome B [Shewanella xiamenensis]QQK61929.1 heme A synthase [Shewanella sp. LC6]TPE47635.1 heme A synthase [Shewanella sp. LC2]